jgi:FkbM family methyltransferase
MLIPFSTVVATHARGKGFEVRGVFHVGANTCEEAADYAREGVKEVIWFEADPSVATLQRARGFDCHEVLAADTDGDTVTFNIANQCGSSSMLELGEHRIHHPSVYFSSRVKLVTQRLDTYVAAHKIDMTKYNFLNVDVQGAELRVLKGMGPALLKGFDILYLEVNTSQVYIGCALMHELDAFLAPLGFTRADTQITSANWGDAVYVRTKQPLQQALAAANANEQKHQQTAQKSGDGSPAAAAAAAASGKDAAASGKDAADTVTSKLFLSAAPVIENHWSHPADWKGLAATGAGQVGVRILLDVGAHRGLHADAHMARFDKLVLVEASARLAAFLRDKYKGNDKVTIVERLVSDQKRATFYSCNVDTVSTAAPQWINQSRFSHQSFQWTAKNDIATVSMDELVRQYGVPTRTKIDVEAYELSVVRSLSRHIGLLSFEWAEEGRDDAARCVHHLASLGYTKFFIQHGDQYDFTPQPEAWTDADRLVATLDDSWNPARRELWGMIHAT